MPSARCATTNSNCAQGAPACGLDAVRLGYRVLMWSVASRLTWLLGTVENTRGRVGEQGACGLASVAFTSAAVYLHTSPRGAASARGGRDVAQSGSAPEWGSGGRGFKSRRPDWLKIKPCSDVRCGASSSVSRAPA